MLAGFFAIVKNTEAAILILCPADDLDCPTLREYAHDVQDNTSLDVLGRTHLENLRFKRAVIVRSQSQSGHNSSQFLNHSRQADNSYLARWFSHLQPGENFILLGPGQRCG